MPHALLEKPSFTVDQMTSATEAAKRFAEVRRRAKDHPQFITDHNTVDSVILSYEEYEKMYSELVELREQAFLDQCVKRIATGDSDPQRVPLGLHEAMDAEDYADYLACDPDSIADEDLFE